MTPSTTSIATLNDIELRCSAIVEASVAAGTTQPWVLTCSEMQRLQEVPNAVSDMFMVELDSTTTVCVAGPVTMVADSAIGSLLATIKQYRQRQQFQLDGTAYHVGDISLCIGSMAVPSLASNKHYAVVLLAAAHANAAHLDDIASQLLADVQLVASFTVPHPLNTDAGKCSFAEAIVATARTLQSLR